MSAGTADRQPGRGSLYPHKGSIFRKDSLVYVFVVDRNRQPLDPCHPARARKLLRKGRAAVFRRFPFTLILRDRTLEGSVTHAHRVKIDPGAQTTGIAIMQQGTGRVVFAAELTHRGTAIRNALAARRVLRRGRRQRKTRYRPPRFNNRRRREGWLPPSLESKVANVQTWVARLCRVCPVAALSLELVRFDMQALQNPAISGIAYQRGTLYGYEARAYLLEKWGRRCVYCGAHNVTLEIDHIVSKNRGGSDRVANLTLACRPCNAAKGNHPLEEFLKDKPDVMALLQRHAQAPLAAAAAVNTTRWVLHRRLLETGLPVECGSGGRTQFNRTHHSLPKAHWIDAVCVGLSAPETLRLKGVVPLKVKAVGHGSRQMCRMDKYGFPRTSAKQSKRVRWFQTGDIVRAVVARGKQAGVHIGRVAIRTSGSFRVGTTDGISWRWCKLLHKSDGYDYIT